MTVPTHSEATEVDALEKNASWTVGSIGYLLSTAWWNTWVQYSSYTGPGASSAASLLQLPGGSGPRPGPISNTDLLQSENSTAEPHLSNSKTPEWQPAPDPEAVPLRLGLVEQRDFVVVSAATWKYLHSAYGGGPAIVRHVVAEAAPGTSGRKDAAQRWGRLALYPLRLEVLYKPKDGTERSAVVVIDPEASLAALKARACAALGVAESEVNLWDYTGGKPLRSLEAAPPRVVDGTATTAVEDGTPAAPATADGGANRSGSGGGGASMDIDSTAVAVIANGVMGRTLREVPLLDQQLLGLRKTDAGINSFNADDEDDEDACGSDNDNDTGTAAGRKVAGKNATGRMSIAEEAAAAAVRRASTAGNVHGDGGSGAGVLAPPATARTSGTGTGLPFGGSNRQRPSWGTLEDNVVQRDGQPPGLAGLSNLGNTCFMNSSLQCLAHAVPLMTAFLGGAYLQDLNRTNPLGMKGELAEAFGALMELLWRGGLSAVTPRSFKAKIGRFAPQFSGYAQHDSQEFLAFLLDGLHEDTNRIKNKPYIEEKDQSGQPDEEVAAEAWANYRARNNSLVVDHFQGLFKSTVDCPQCGFNSVKFDPFMYLSLPLPESRRRVVEVILVRTDGSELPCRMALELPSGATLADLLRATAQAGGFPAEVISSPDAHLLAARPLRPPAANNDELALLTDSRMRVADALDGGSGSNYSLRGSSSNSDSGLVVYYYPDAARGPRAEGLAPVIVHFKRPDSRRTASWNRGVWCGAPLVLYMPEDRPPYNPEQVVKVSSGPGNRSEWEISGDCPLAASLVEVLRPIQRLPLASAQQPTPKAASPADGRASPGPREQAEASLTALAVVPVAEQPGADEVAAPHPINLDPIDVARQHGGTEQRSVAAPMEEDERQLAGGVVNAVGHETDATCGAELCPSTPTWEGDRGAAGAGAGVVTSLRRWSSSSGGGSGGRKDAATGDLMEGVESLSVPVPATDVVPIQSACGFTGGLPGGHGDASMPGTPEPSSYGPMEDDVGAAGPASLPPVIIMGPPESAYPEETEGLGPSIQPFDMWAAQSTWGPEDVADTAGAAVVGPSGTSTAANTASAVPFSGSPFSLKLCNGKGESSLWGGIHDKDIKVEHHREFLLMFNDGCAGGTGSSAPASINAAAAAATSLGPYAADLLDSPTEHPSLGEHRRRAAAGPQPVSLDACMATFLQPERLAESDAWYCPRCKSHVCADKKLDLWSLPEVLVVHLKRFSYTRYSRNKLDTRVDFPLHGLDLGPYVMRPQGVGPVYDLFAVSNHYGSLGGGHYTAYAKLPSPPPPGSNSAAQGAGTETPLDDRWYCFDDSHVSSVAPEAVRSPAAYVLFYRRRAEAATDPLGVEELLTQLREQRDKLEKELESAAGMPSVGPGVPGTGAGPGGSTDSGSDRQPAQDQDQGQGSRGVLGVSRHGGALGMVGEVSIAAAAAAAQAARGNEELDVEGRSMTAFSLGSRDAAAAGSYRHRCVDGSDGRGGTGGAASNTCCDGAVRVGSPRHTPVSVGNTYGGTNCDADFEATANVPSTDLDADPLQYGAYGNNRIYDPAEFGAFHLDDGVGAGSLGIHGDGELLQPPGSPAEPELDLNNADLTGLYQEVEDMDVVRDRHSGSDMASAGGNDLDQDADGEDVIK